MLFWILLLLDFIVSSSIGSAMSATPAGYLVFTITSFVVLALISFIIVMFLSLLVPRSEPRIRKERNFRITSMDDEYIYYMKDGKKTKFPIAYISEQRFTQFEPFIQEVDFCEGGWAGFWLFDIHKYDKEFFLYM